jgi:hypothetical protein
MKMTNGILYVVFNKWINNPETHETPYKIGITKGSIEDRYYGLGLKMPGKFEALFAYELENCTKAEQAMQGILYKFRENGEWFNINQNELDLIKKNCEAMGGVPVTDEVSDEINEITEILHKSCNVSLSEFETEDKTNTELSITIKGVNIPLYKNNNENTQDFVKRILHIMFNNNLIPNSEIQNMLNKDYSKDTFEIAYPMLQNNESQLYDRVGHPRYWKTEIFGGRYYACSQWWKDNADIYEHKLASWIKKIANLNENA